MDGWISRVAALTTAVIAELAALVLVAATIDLLEQLSTRLLVRRFGWSSLLVTGWIGTPIHELSHLLACIAFGHRIDQVALFRPDANNGQLGFVRHSYQRGNWFQEIGNLFIAVAPLIGGSLTMLLLIKLCFPSIQLFPNKDLIQQHADAIDLNLLVGTVRGTGYFAGNLIRQIATVEHLQRLAFWAFVYIATCIASHMAPSRSDYRSAVRAVLVLSAVSVCVVALICIGAESARAGQYVMAFAFGITISLGLMAVALCVASTSIIFAVTAIWDVLVRKNG